MTNEIQYNRNGKAGTLFVDDEVIDDPYFFEDAKGRFGIAYIVDDVNGGLEYDWDDFSTPHEQWSDGYFVDFRLPNEHGRGPRGLASFVEECSDRFGPEYVFIVDCFEHGVSDYSLAGTKQYPHSQWDVARSGVLVIPKDFDDGRVYAGIVLDEYSKLVRGEVYGVAEVILDDDGLVVEEEFIGGVIGLDSAKQIAQDSLGLTGRKTL
jgi:hypothetical protein